MDNFNYKKSLGQNFLNDNNVVHKIVDSADIDKDTLLIEIGPGSGAITKHIVPLCGHAILYEIDGRLENNLKNVLNEYNNYSIIIKDFLKVDIASDIGFYNYKKLFVVANLPYYITTPIIMKFIDNNIFPDKFVIMIQKEVASRFAAKVGSRDYGSLTVFLNYFYSIDKLFDVSKNCFIPRPNVDSAVIEMRLKDKKLQIDNMELFKRVVKDSFQYKRKNLKNNLKKYDLDIVLEILKKYGYDLDVRAEMLDFDFFVLLSNKLNETIK